MNDKDILYEIRKAVEEEIQRIDDDNARSGRDIYNDKFPQKILKILRGE